MKHHIGSTPEMQTPLSSTYHLISVLNGTNNTYQSCRAPTKFPHKVCGEEFNNPQALGGHQNKHRLEIALAKTARDAQTAQAMQQRLQRQREEEEEEELESMQQCPNTGLCVLCMRMKSLSLSVGRPDIAKLSVEKLAEILTETSKRR